MAYPLEDALDCQQGLCEKTARVAMPDLVLHKMIRSIAKVAKWAKGFIAKAAKGSKGSNGIYRKARKGGKVFWGYLNSDYRPMEFITSTDLYQNTLLPLHPLR